MPRAPRADTLTALRIACSTGTLPRALDARYHQVEAVYAAIQQVPVRDIELVLHPDWRPQVKPRTTQPDPWEVSAKWNPGELLVELQDGLAGIGARVRSVHANRDIGVFLTSDDERDVQLGMELLNDNCHIATGLDADLVVIHAWDTWAAAINVERIAAALTSVASQHDALTLTLENIPVSAEGWTQHELMKELDRILPPKLGFTLDLSWASLYDNLDALLPLMARFRNVHVQGRIQRDSDEMALRARAGEMDIGQAVRAVKAAGYQEQWTLELNRPRSLDDFRQALTYLATAVED